MRAAHKLGLMTALSAILTFTSSAMAAPELSDFKLAAKQPEVLVELAGKDSDGVFIVRLEDPSLAAYNGGIRGLAATSAQATGKRRLDVNSRAANRYKAHLGKKQRSVLAKAGREFGRSLKPRFSYKHAINGFAVELTSEEAKKLRKMSGVKAVQRERLEYPLTDVGPDWINAPSIWRNGRNSSKGEGLVIAVLDSGINSDHPSFAAVGGDGYAVQNPLGSGNFMPGSYCDTVDPTFCNDKLIGAWDFTSIDGTVPEDDDGHGSHTASTAAGNVVLGASIETPTTSVELDISGVAPHANIIAYDVCQATCPGSALIAAMDQVIIDNGNLPNGIAALNYSISGGDDPYNDNVELAFLAAVEAGIYVAASAGNSGPDASTVAHLGPWVSTTAASTHSRSIDNSLVGLVSDGDSLANLNGASFSSGYGPAKIIHANTIPSDPEGQCLTPFPPGTFNGEIVMCDRGTIARTEKGENVLAGGAGGYILGNLGQGESTVADAHFLPAIHLGDTAAAALRSWLASNTNTMGMITDAQFSYDRANGDIMADFSSRGPQQKFDVLKPDLTAPGVDILAATADGVTSSVPEYEFLSGTSMSSPHNAGAGALMSGVHPDWTPAEIKSALMLTAITKRTYKEDGKTKADPFDLGAGRIDLARAKKAGLVMSETVENFMYADPAYGGDPSTLNLASMMNSNCVGICSWTRTVTNKTNRGARWFVSAEGKGFDVRVFTGYGGPLDSASFHDGDGPVRLFIPAGGSATFTVMVNNLTALEGWQFGEVKLSKFRPRTREGQRSRRSARDMAMPIAVYASKASNSSLFTKTVNRRKASSGDRLRYRIDITNGQLEGPISVTDALPEGLTYVADSAQQTVSNGTTTSPFAYDSETNTVSWSGSLDPSGIEVVNLSGNVTGFFPLSNLGISPLSTLSNCDEGGYLIDVSSFTYNGQSYNDVIMSVNGTVEAGTASFTTSGWLNNLLPDGEAPNNILAPLWTDLNACDGGTMSTAELVLGDDAWAVFEWKDVPLWSPDNSGTEPMSFQLWILLDGSPTPYPPAHFAYGPLSPFLWGTIGAENATGTTGSTYYFDGGGSLPSPTEDLGVFSTPGGTALLRFEADVHCYEDNLVVNEALLSEVPAEDPEVDSAAEHSGEFAIAVTECEASVPE